MGSLERATDALVAFGDWAGGVHREDFQMVYVCGPIDHDYVQAANPYENILYCRKCGDGKYLRAMEVPENG